MRAPTRCDRSRKRAASRWRRSLAWLLAQPQVTSVIIGAKRPDQLADNIAAAKVTLSADELKQLDGVSGLPSEYPGWMLERRGQYRRKQISDAQL